jgi:hypothetical protein
MVCRSEINERRAVRKDGGLNRGRRCAVMWVFPQILRSHYGPGVDSASNRNEYQVYFLGLKEAGA